MSRRASVVAVGVVVALTGCADAGSSAASDSTQPGTDDSGAIESVMPDLESPPDGDDREPVADDDAESSASGTTAVGDVGGEPTSDVATDSVETSDAADDAATAPPVPGTTIVVALPTPADGAENTDGATGDVPADVGDAAPPAETAAPSPAEEDDPPPTTTRAPTTTRSPTTTQAPTPPAPPPTTPTTVPEPLITDEELDEIERQLAEIEALLAEIDFDLSQD
ncbi:MAG: hypothetical protein HKN41_01425 [Ilumatobacter sp.]|nr:hypothetical protein [Ilumatobacter sp.]